MKNVSEKLKNLASEKRSYALQALIAHLKEAGQLADIHRLLALETSEGHNIWYEMKEQTGDTSGYVADITLAWDLANDSFHEGFSSPPQTRVSSNTGAVLVLQLRYGLILASLTSSTDHLQPALLAAVVTKNLWTLPQALAYILRIPETNRALVMVEALLPLVPTSQLHQVLAMMRLNASAAEDEARSGRDGNLRKIIRIVEAVVPRLAAAGELEEALGATRDLTANFSYPLETTQIELFAMICSNAPEPLREKIVREALGKARTMNPPDLRAHAALASLLPHASEVLQEEILLEVLSGLGDAQDRPSWASQGQEQEKMLRVLAPYLRVLKEDSVRKAIALTRGRVTPLREWIPYVPEALRDEVEREALQAAKHITNTRSRASALEGLVLHLSGNLQSEAIQATMRIVQDMWSSIDRGEKRGSVPHGDIPGTDVMWIAYDVARILAALVPLLPAEEREQTAQQALAAARVVIREEHVVEQPGGGLNYILPEGERMQWAGEVFVAAANHFSEPFRSQVLQELLNEADAFRTSWVRKQAFVALMPLLPDPLREEAVQRMLVTVRRMKNTENPASVIASLFPFASEEVREEMLHTALERMKETENQVSFLIHLLPLASGQVREEMLQITSNILQAPDLETREARIELFVQIVSSLPSSMGEEFSQKILMEILMTTDPRKRFDYLDKLAPHLSENQLKEALRAAQEIRDDVDQIKVHAALFPDLSVARQREILEMIKAISDAELRATILATIAPSAPETLREEVMEERIRTIQAIKGYSRQALFEGLIPSLVASGAYRRAAMMIQKGGANERERIDLLTEIVGPLAMKDPLAAYALVQEMDGGGEALVHIAPYLPETFQQEVLTEIRAMDDYTKVWALSVVGPYREKSLLHEALTIAQAIPEEEMRVQALMNIFSRFPVDEREQYLSRQLLHDLSRIARNIQDGGDRASALVEIGLCLPEQQRDQLLEEALTELRDVNDVKKEEVLTRIAHCLTEALVQQAIAIAHTMDDQDGRGKVVASLACRLAVLGHQQEAVEEVLKLSGYVSDLFEDTVAPRDAGIQELALQLATLKNFDAALKLAQKLSSSSLGDSLRGTLVYLLSSQGYNERALAEVGSMSSSRRRAGALGIMASYLAALPQETLFPLFRRLFPDLPTMNRQELLEIVGELVPVLVALGETKAAEDMAKAVQDVDRWWP